jgi:hypothetical protein
MKQTFKVFFFIGFAFLAASTSQAAKIKNFILDSSRIYEIKVAADHRGTTTLMFPSALGALNGTNITNKPNVPGAFFMTYNAGSYFFSLESQREEAKGSINVVFDHKIYVLKIITVPEAEAYSSVTFKSVSEVVGNSGGGRSITPTVLRDLIEKARLYYALKENYPDYYENMTIIHKNQLFKYTAYNVFLENIYRFKVQDTIVFQLVVKNNTNRTLVYDPQLLAARLGSKLYYSSLTLGSGKIPPHSESPVFFTVTGTSSGGRNDISVDNNWIILLTASRIDQKITTLDLNKKILGKESDLKAELKRINSRLSSNNISNNELKILSVKITKINKELGELRSTKILTQ